jgi:hypothetical protein
VSVITVHLFHLQVVMEPWCNKGYQNKKDRCILVAHCYVLYNLNGNYSTVDFDTPLWDLNRISHSHFNGINRLLYIDKVYKQIR